MKKLLLIPALLGSLAMAADYNYELTPVVGYNFTGSALPLEDYGIIGAEFQYNGFDFPIKPEASILYSIADYEPNLPGYKDVADTTVVRIALNGVYEFDMFESFTPLVKAGAGYANMDDPYDDVNRNLFVDAGVGAKIPFSDDIALKLEAIYMIQANRDTYDGNLAILAGLNFAFGEKGQKSAPVAAPAVKKALPKTAPKTAAVAAPVVAAVATIDADDDNDGVSNSKDKCPNTPKNVKKVDADGCAEVVNLTVGFGFDSYEVTADNYNHIEDFVLFMKDHANYDAKIIGHTDSTGSEAFNQILSERRATATKAVIVTKGIDAKRVTTVGKGETEPTTSNKTKGGRAQNRRIEVEIIKN